MKRRAWVWMVGPAALCVGLVAFVLRARAIPLGWPGEWTWERLGIEVAPNALGWIVGAVSIVAYALIVFGVQRWLAGTPGRSRCAVALGGLAALSIAMQLLIQGCAPQGYGLTKWPVSLHSEGSNGYFTIARGALMDDPGAFLRAYPTWIKSQDALHVGTHPPGLFVIWRGVLGYTRSNAALSRAIVASSPGSVRAGFELVARFAPLATAEQAAIVVMGAGTLVLCALAVVPIYGLGRGCALSPSEAFGGAALWPLVPAAILFQPTADTVYPTLAASAVALSMSQWRGAAVVAGVVLALSLQLTLAFFAVGLLVALLIAGDRACSWRARIVRLLAIGCGFALATGAFWWITGANPLVTWWWNQVNHRRFYEQFPRSYWVWMALNPIEFAVALGVPIVVAALAALPSARGARLAGSTILVLALLQASGRNLSEVARLWLPLMPMLLPAAVGGLARAGGRAAAVAALVWLVGVQTLIMQSMIQVVYPAT